MDKKICDKLKVKFDHVLSYKKDFDDYFESGQKDRDITAIEDAHISISNFHQELMRFRLAFGSLLFNSDKLKLMRQKYEHIEGRGIKLTPDPNTLMINRSMGRDGLGQELFEKLNTGDRFKVVGAFGFFQIFPGDEFIVVGFTKQKGEEDSDPILLYKGENEKHNNKAFATSFDETWFDGFARI